MAIEFALNKQTNVQYTGSLLLLFRIDLPDHTHLPESVPYER